MQIKVCKKCGEPKALTEFNRDARRRDGHHPYCKACKSAEWRDRYERGKDRILAQHKVHYEMNRDAVLARQKVAYTRKRAEQPALPKPPRATLSPEEKRARKRAWAVAHRAVERDQKRARRHANPSHAREVHARWRETNRIRILSRHHARQARLLGRAEAWTVAEWDALITVFGNRCLCCGATERITIDHVIPMRKGGSNLIANLQPLCLGCNNHKKQRTTDYRDPALLAAFLVQLEPQE